MILVINSGSSSIKYKVFNLKSKKPLLAKGMIDRIGFKDSVALDHKAAIKVILDRLVYKESGVLKDISQISAVGHRVVHGGERFREAVIIDKYAIRWIRKFSRLAPLHNPPNLLGIEACMKFLPDIPHIAVFDTAFYQTLPEAHYIYALPYYLYKKEGIRKYGFHGTSHKYVTIKTAQILKKPLTGLKIITCHLGNGCSITASIGGRALDTSMGFTPLEGLVMGTRSGDIDPIIVIYLMEKMKLDKEDVDRLLNRKSGLLGLSELSSDMRDIYKALMRNNKKARLAFDIFIHRIHKYIGAYIVSMNGVDAITFTGGIGENHSPTRKEVCKNLKFLGLEIDDKKNMSNDVIVSKRTSKIKVLVIPTDEELMIAKEVNEILKKQDLCKKFYD